MTRFRENTTAYKIMYQTEHMGRFLQEAKFKKSSRTTFHKQEPVENNKITHDWTLKKIACKMETNWVDSVNTAQAHFEQPQFDPKTYKTHSVKEFYKLVQKTQVTKQVCTILITLTDT